MAVTQFELSRAFWDFTFENPEKVTPTHIAIFFFSVEHCNRLGWKDKFGLPTSMVLEAIGVKSYNTFKPCFNDLAEWGFIKVIEYSKNQYSSNIIALSIGVSKNNKALDKALAKHGTKHLQSTVQSTGSIDKQVTINKEQITIGEFERFWLVYGKPTDKKKCLDRFKKLELPEIETIFRTLPNYLASTPEVKFRKNPLTYLNGKCWEDMINMTPSKKPYVPIPNNEW